MNYVLCIALCAQVLKINRLFGFEIIDINYYRTYADTLYIALNTIVQ